MNRLLARSREKVKAHVFFPTTTAHDWTTSSLRRNATAIPGVTVSDDPEGEQARLFGAETSGSVLLFDRAGKMIFHGGITSSRGHAGDNVGESAVLSLVVGEKTVVTQTPVFGCALLNAARDSSSETP
ncbi:MAG TPA: hypothetical protein VK530_16080 [Candidatus Acidoferrum sp.]|nr:hypothetical protein [Candidatus Acidoferrum sp.]